MAYSMQDLVDIFLNQLKEEDKRLANVPSGSAYDAFAGATAAVGQTVLMEDALNYEKKYIQTAESTDLDYLVTDLFGIEFSRPVALTANGLVTFYLNAETNPVTIPVGTVVKTVPDAFGNVIRYQTLTTVTLSPSASSVAVGASSFTSGVSGNVAANTLTVIESSLTSGLVTCTNLTAINNGEDEYSDAKYRTWVYNKLATYLKFSLKAIEDAALTVTDINFANATETILDCKEWNGTTTVGDSFKISRAFLYIGNSDGRVITNNVISQVQNAIRFVRALGVYIDVKAVLGVQLVWSISASLNPASPYYSQLAGGDFSPIFQAMQDIILALPYVTTDGVLVTFDPVSSLSTLVTNSLPNTLLNAVNLMPTTPVSISQAGQKFLPAVTYNGNIPSR